MDLLVFIGIFIALCAGLWIVVTIVSIYHYEHRRLRERRRRP